ncbi:MAG: ribonuclease III [Parahaliea sp.]
MNKLDRLEQRLGYSFADKSLLQLALTHRSVGSSNNERLEFLGDSIVNHVIAEAIYHRFPDVREGDMSRMRASLVKGDTLARIARELELGDYLLLGSGERKSGGHRRNSILADTFEALAGAILLDSNYNCCKSRLLVWFDARLDTLASGGNQKDAKTRLQEYLQGQGIARPNYELLAVEGEDHAQHFEVSCHIGKPRLSARGSGASRRKAEQAAAKAVLEALTGHG